MSDYFLLYANCHVTKGIKRSLIVDTLRGRYYFIPNSMGKIIRLLKKKSIEEVKITLPTLEQFTFEEYLNYLIKLELGFITNQPKSFPDIGISFEEPCLLNNCVFDVNKFSRYDLIEGIKKIDSIGCSYLQIRSYDDYLNYETIKEILQELHFSSFKSVYITTQFNNEDSSKILNLLDMNLRLSVLIFHSAPFDEGIKKDYHHYYLVKEKIVDESCCGIVNEDYFISNIKFYLESLKFNSCLNKKIGIDKNGFVKNCPSSKIIYGNINEINVEKLLCNSEFTETWKINKSQISICKICEFRNICQDCRIYTKDNTNLDPNNFEKPLKCNYNPYNLSWEK